MADETPETGTDWSTYYSPEPDNLAYLRASYTAMGLEMPDLSWPAVSAAIGRSHNPDFCTMCGPEAMTEALRAAAQDTMRYVEQSWPVGSVAGEAPVPQFPRDWVSPWVGIMARAAAAEREAALRLRLVRMVRAAIEPGIRNDLHAPVPVPSSMIADHAAEIAVDVFTEAVRKGEL